MQRSASILSRCRVLWGHVALGQDHRLAASVAASGHPPGCNTLRRFSLSTSDPTPGGGNDGNNSSNTSSSPSNTETTNTPSAAPQQQEQPAATGSPEAPSPRRPIVPVASAAVQALAEQLQQSSAASGSLAELFPQQQLLQQQPGGRAGRQRQQAGAADATAPAAAGSSQPALSATTNVVDVIMMAVENCRPLMTVQQSKAGTRVVYVPRPLRPDQSTAFAIKWIVQAATKRRESSSRAPMAQCLAAELLLAAQKKGGARAKRDELHKLALDNRANLRTRWW